MKGFRAFKVMKAMAMVMVRMTALIKTKALRRGREANEAEDCGLRLEVPSLHPDSPQQMPWLRLQGAFSSRHEGKMEVAR